jgi:uncharacterized membrane protein
MVIRISVPPVIPALLLSGTAFLLGFALSRYVIDRELRQADAAVLESAYELDRLETVMAQQFRSDYQLLEVKVKAMQPKTEQH